jgi:hypothetical protein
MGWYSQFKLERDKTKAAQKQAYHDAQHQYNLYCNQQKEIKMIREEAFKKLKYSVLNRPGTVANDEAVNDWLNALEALGLIKFDEPVPADWELIYKSMTITGLASELDNLKVHAYSVTDYKKRIYFLKTELILRIVKI